MQGNSKSSKSPKDIPLIVRQCKILIDLLSILHSRIKTKFPSRFLSTSLSAVLAGISKTHDGQENLIKAALDLARALDEQTRHGRNSSDQKESQAPDPEAYQGENSSADDLISKRLIQAFITHLVELHALAIPSDDECPGLSSSANIFEDLEPQKVVRHMKISSEFAEKSLQLQLRMLTSQNLYLLAKSVGLFSEDLWTVVENIEIPESVEGENPLNSP